jgi:hypothetical protein
MAGMPMQDHQKTCKANQMQQAAHPGHAGAPMKNK